MELSYHQILAEVYDENAKNILVDQNEYEDEDQPPYEQYNYGDNELESPEEFNKSHGDRGKPEHVIKPDPKEHHTFKRPEVRTIVLNIDGAFRGNIVPNTYTLCTGASSEAQLSVGTSSSNFLFMANKLYRNITSVKMTSMEFANTFYTFSESRGNTVFKITVSGIPYLIKIDDGNYNANSIVTAVANRLTALSVPGVTFTYNSITHKFAFNNFGNSKLEFPVSTSNPYGNGIGYNLGFTRSVYTTSSLTVLESDSTPDMVQDTYVYLQINDWNLLEHQQYGQTFYSVYSKIQLNGSKNTVIFDNNFTNSSTKEYVFPQPVNLQRFEIRMLDAYGNTLDLRNGTFSMTLELQQVDSSAVFEDLIKTL